MCIAVCTTLRPLKRLFVCKTPQADVSFGALRVFDPALRPHADLQRVLPLEVNVGAYAAQWRRDAAGIEATS